MRRYLTVGIIFGLLAGIVLVVSWWAFPAWRNPTSGGFWTLLGLTLVAVLAAVRDLISIWKNLSQNKKQDGSAKTREPVQAVALQQAQTIVNAPGGVINWVHTTETSTEVPTQQPTPSAESAIQDSEPESSVDASESMSYPMGRADDAPGLRLADTVIDGLNWAVASPSDIFYERLCDAFPGLRGVETFEAEEAISRLEVLLQEPLGLYLPDGSGLEPFWWFRGSACLPIRRFRRLDDEHILMDVYEIRIHEIVVVREFSANERNFVYVHGSADEATGLYSYTQEWLDAYLEDNLAKGWGYYFSEEYGLWEGKTVTRQEYDDGAAIIDGKPTRIRGAELRVRYVTPYNFVICGKDHVLNGTPDVDAEAAQILNGILHATNTVDDLITLIEGLHRSWLFRGYSQ